MAMGTRVLAGRYAPPRSKDGRFSADKWNVTRDIDSWKTEDGIKKARLLIQNNARTGSAEPYQIRSIVLHYRAIEPRYE